MGFRQTSKNSIIPDFTLGTYSNTYIVSNAMRALVEEYDPGVHYYAPIILTMKDGRVLEDQYHVFKIMRFVDAVIESKSQVGPMYYNGKLGFYSTSARPKLTLKRDVVEGLHVWSDVYLKDRFFCSDAFIRQMDSRRFGPFERFETFIGDEPQAVAENAS
jgi:hypothetical protein